MSKNLNDWLQMGLIVYWSHSVFLLINVFAFIIALAVKFEMKADAISATCIALFVYFVINISFVYGFWHRVNCLMLLSLAFTTILFVALIVGFVRFGIEYGQSYEELNQIYSKRPKPVLPVNTTTQLKEQCRQLDTYSALQVVIELREPLAVLVLSYLVIMLLAMVANASLIIRIARSNSRSTLLDSNLAENKL